MKQLETADPQQAQRLSEEIQHLQDQLKEHRRTFERMDESAGVGYVAADDRRDRDNSSQSAEPETQQAKPSVKIKGEDSEYSGNWESTKDWLDSGEFSSQEKYQEVYKSVLDEMPDSVRKAAEGQNITTEQYQGWVKEWSEQTTYKEVGGGIFEAQTYDYERNPQGAEQLVKDAILYKFHKEGWTEIGFAEYMTGDASTAALATALKEDTTLRVIKGDKKKTGSKKPAPSFLEGEDKRLPRTFDKAQERRQVVIEDVNQNDASKGTQDTYGKDYKPYDGNSTVKPYKTETSEGTRIVAEEYAKLNPKHPEYDPEKAAQIRKTVEDVLLPSDPGVRDGVKQYKKDNLAEIGESPVFLIWGRNSGKNGGAHPELDSHSEVLMQSIKTAAETDPSRTVVLVGDKVLSDDQISQLGTQGIKIVQNEEYWKQGSWKDKAGNSGDNRRAQNYLIKLLGDENDAISIGMRSGGLEASALLGNKTIYFDDKAAGGAGERMEMFAGTAATERDKLIREGADEQKRTEYEKEKEGPVENYKRISTTNQLGNEVDSRATNNDVVQSGLRKIVNGESNNTQQPKGKQTKAIDELSALSDDIPVNSQDSFIFLERVNRYVKDLSVDKNNLHKRNLDPDKVQKALRSIEYAAKNNSLLESERKQLSFLIEYFNK